MSDTKNTTPRPTPSESRLDDSPCYQDLADWIKQAAPMLETATCIVIDENIERLDEIAGVRAVLEMCPIDFTDNVQDTDPK